jgi:single-strand DNA-binding protein
MKPVRGTVNYVELIGWLGNDPEERYTPSGVAIAEFSVAAKRLGSRNEDGSWNYDTDWIDVVAYHGQLADRYLGRSRRQQAQAGAGSRR